MSCRKYINYNQEQFFVLNFVQKKRHKKAQSLTLGFSLVVSNVLFYSQFSLNHVGYINTFFGMI